MRGKFDNLIKLIPVLKEKDFGTMIVDRENDGTPEHPIRLPFIDYSESVRELERAIYDFDRNNPDTDLHNYSAILEENGLEWSIESMEHADVSDLDSTAVMALLLGAVRADRFSEGTLLSFLESGAVVRWLERLKEISEEQA